MTKQGLLMALFALLVVYAVLRIRASDLHTPLSLTSDILNVVVAAGAVILSFLEDQRSTRPSDLLVIYFSLLSLLWIPRLRSLWLISSSGFCRVLWTTIYIVVVLIAFLESTRKSKTLHPSYKYVTVEQASGFWSRSIFRWVVPSIRLGYSTILSIGDMPRVDESLQGDVAREKLDRAWQRSKGRYRLVKAVFRAYRWTALSGVVPRIILAGFTFCQPFLITSTVDYFAGEATEKPKEYGQALVGAFLLVYLGIAVRLYPYYGPRGLNKYFLAVLSSSILTMSSYRPLYTGVKLTDWAQWCEEASSRDYITKPPF